MVHFVRLVKSGSSLGVVLPAPVREAMHLGRGDQLALTIEGKRLILVKLDDRRTAELIAKLNGVEDDKDGAS